MYDNSLLINIYTLSTLWALAFVGFTYYFITATREITYVTLADGRKQERKIPILFRMFLPFTANITPFLNRDALTNMRTKTDRQLVAAGYEGMISGEELMALRIILTLVLGGFWVLIIMLSAQTSTLIESQRGLLSLFGPVWFFFYPKLWLKQMMQARHRDIRRSLPFVLDVLTLSVEAGMDFMTAIQRHVERSAVNPLEEELIRVVREIQLGKTRKESLKAMSSRVDMSDLRSVVNALVQADELGVSIGAIIRIQSDQIRLRRFERAEKLANEAPVKMLGPLIFFIFPAVFLVLLGPVLYKMASNVM